MCVRVSRKERQGNWTLCDLDVSGRGEHGLQRGVAALGGVLRIGD